MYLARVSGSLYISRLNKLSIYLRKTSSINGLIDTIDCDYKSTDSEMICLRSIKIEMSLLAPMFVLFTCLRPC